MRDRSPLIDDQQRTATRKDLSGKMAALRMKINVPAA